MVNTLQTIYRLETQLYRMERQRSELKQQVAQARYDLRLAKAAQVEYQGSLRSLLDKFSGKQAQRTEELSRAVRMAESRQTALLREQAALEESYAAAQKERQALPPREALSPTDPETARQLNLLESRLLAEMLLPALEENYEALWQMRDLLQGNRMGQIMSREERQDICTLPDTTGEVCAGLLARLETAVAGTGQSFALADYYRAPVAYINAVASDALRRDRLNLAMDQALETKKRISRLLESLGD